MIREQHHTEAAAIVASLVRGGTRHQHWHQLRMLRSLGRPSERERDDSNQEEQGLAGNTKQRQGKSCSS